MKNYSRKLTLKDSVVEYLKDFFSAHCSPFYDSIMKRNYGFDRGSSSYSSEEERFERMSNPDWGVSHYLLDVQYKRQCYQTMRSALKTAWPEVVRKLSTVGIFEKIESTLKECEKILAEFLKEISPLSEEQKKEIQAREEMFLSPELRTYIETVRFHCATLPKRRRVV